MPETTLTASLTSEKSSSERVKLVYVLTSNGEDPYADMALVSMLSVDLSNPAITTVLLVDAQSMESLQRNRHQILQLCDSIITVDTPPGSAVFRSRWMKTQVGRFVHGAVIYLDADTLARKPIDWPKHFDSTFGAVADAPGMAPSEDPLRLQLSQRLGWDPSSTYFNSGFFYYLSSPGMDRFFELWHSLWQDTRGSTNFKDQPSFNAAISLADFRAQELPATFNHQITLSWEECQRSTIWHFWESSRMSGDILDELTQLVGDLPIDRLRSRVHRGIMKRTPAAYSNRLARAMDLLFLNPELQRKLLFQTSRLSTGEFVRWSLRRLTGHRPSP
jgi:hypothetical protein